jgi:hypothetical protein
MATIVGGTLAFPVNYWLVANHLKHGMGTLRAIGRGGHSVELERGMDTRREKAGMHGEHSEGTVSQIRIIVMSALTLLMLSAGAIIAAFLD